MENRQEIREAFARNRRKRRNALIAITLSLSIVMTMFAVVFTVDTPKEVHALGVVTTSITLVYQHYDTTMHCNPCGGSGTLGPHPWNHAKGTDGIYGNLDDCPHCSCYCAPASISMIALYRGLTPPVTYQDDIYDSGELELGMGEATGDKIIDRHGVGMCDGTGLPFLEVQIAFAAALGGFVQHDHGGLNSVLTQAQLRQYIVTQHPVLWLDHNGWPANMSTAFPTGDYRSDQGHAKVIAGYDDNATADFIDDLCLIYDPWPEYNDLGVTPVNATKGPGGTYDPYWLPLNDVNLSDTSDIYLVDTYPDIPEFGTVLVPVLGLVLIAVVLSWKRRKGDGKRSEMGPCSDPESRI